MEMVKSMELWLKAGVRLDYVESESGPKPLSFSEVHDPKS